MNLSQWVQSLWSGKTRKSSKQARRRGKHVRLSLEAFEDRIVPSNLVVNSTADTLAPPAGTVTLRSAIAQVNVDASGADTITFATTLINPTITLTNGVLTISKSTTISNANFLSDHVTVDGNKASQIFAIATNATVAMTGLTVQNGNSAAAVSGGAILVNNGCSLSMTSCLVQNNSCPGGTNFDANGGAIDDIGTALTLTNCALINNSATGQAGANGSTTGGSGGGGGQAAAGGAIFCSGSVVTITDCTFSGNTAAGGAGGTATVNGGVFTGTGGNGGGSHGGNGTGGTTGNAGTAGNTFGGGGGGGSAAVAGSNGGAGGGLTGEGGGGGGGGGATTDGGQGGTGGAGNTDGGGAGGTATSSGGAGGGGAAGQGGAIFINGGTLNIVGCTIASNTATGGAGGTGPFGGADDGTSGQGQGGGLDAFFGTINIQNTIVANNTATTGQGVDVDRTIIDKGNNLIGVAAGSSGFTAASDKLNVNPALTALINAGYTQIYGLQSTSPALGAGNAASAPATDQRGLVFARTVGGIIDIGAYQHQNLTLNVANSSDPVNNTFNASNLSLREAVKLADASADTTTINFTLSLPATITLDQTDNGSLNLTSPGTVTVNGPGASKLAIDGNAAGRVFNIAAGDTVSISSVTIQNGNVTGDGGGILNNGTLTLQNIVVTNNTASDAGGGFSNVGTGTFTVQTSTFSNNKATGTAGGGIFDSTTSSTANTVTGSTITGNSAAGNGGGISNSAGTITVTNCTLTGNTAGNSGGGIGNAGSLTVAGTTLTGNTANGGSLGTGGGGIRNAGSLNLVNSTIDSNTGGDDGGGILNIGGTAVINASTISRNTAFNSAGVAVYNGTVAIVNSTIAGNQATNNTGGTAAGVVVFTLTATANATATLTQVTLSGNTVALAGDAKDLGVYQSGTGLATATLANTILGSTGSGFPNAITGIGGGTITSSGNNLSFDGTGPATTSDLKGNPLLGPLQNNGGTTLTQLPLPNSPLLNAGSNALAVGADGKTQLTTDQTGGSRIIDGTVDIGAVEAPASIDTTQFQVSSVGINENAGTLTVTVVRTGGSYNAVTATLGAGGTATGDTAVSGVDYSGLPQTVNFASGASSASFNVTILNPTTAAAGAKTLTLTLSSPTGATIGAPATEAVTITDNGPVGGGGTGNGTNGVLAFSSATYSATEASGSVTLTVTRTNGTTGAVTVQYLVSAATSLATKYQAMPGTDFTGTMNATLTFAAGVTSQTITYTLPNPNLVEENTQFVVTLSQPTGGAVVGTVATATVTIVDSDLPTVPNATPAAATLMAAGLGFGTSNEHYQHVIISFYATYLFRTPSAMEMAYWVNLMELYETSNHTQGLRQQDIEAGFLDSAEYLSKNGGAANQTWIDSIYTNLLGRAPDANGVSFWLGQLALGVSAETVALGFTDSQERLTDRVTATYETLLGRAPDANGLAYWINIFNTGGTTEDINSGFVGSAEYYAKANGPLGGGAAGNPAEWIREAYLDVLGRAAQVSEMTYWLSFLKQP